MSRYLIAGALAACLPICAQAGVVVSSYSMPDGADLHGAYFDNAYSGTRSASGMLSGGTGDLTDGVTTVSVAAGYGAWAPYVLWDGLSPVITFDLGASYNLSAITAHFKYYAQAAVFMPGSMDLRFSNDGSNFGATQSRLLSAVERNVAGGDNSDGVFELLTAPGSGRFVEITLNNGPENRWLALAEVSFEGTPGSSGNQVPEPGGLSLALSALAALWGLRSVPGRRAQDGRKSKG